MVKKLFKNIIFIILPGIFFAISGYIAFIFFAIATPNSYPVKWIFIYLLPISLFLTGVLWILNSKLVRYLLFIDFIILTSFVILGLLTPVIFYFLEPSYDLIKLYKDLKLHVIIDTPLIICCIILLFFYEIYKTRKQ